MKRFLISNCLTIILIVLLSVMTVGYAVYDETIALNGSINIEESGVIEISSVTFLSNESSNVSKITEPIIDGRRISFDITGSSDKFSATFLVVVTNDSFYDFTFTDFAFNPFIEGSDKTAQISTTITNYDTGAMIGPGDNFATKTVTRLKVKIDFLTEEKNTTVSVNGNAGLSENNEGSIVPSISPLEGDLTGYNTIDCFNLSVINTYHYTRTFSIKSSNDNLRLVDQHGDDLGNFSIDTNSTNDYEFCLTIKAGSIFLEELTNTTITLSSNGINDINVNNLNIKVDADTDSVDYDNPIVGNVNIKINENAPVNGEATVTWDRIDSLGSPIINYYIILKNETTGVETQYQTGNAVTKYVIGGLSEGTYSVKVYGEDQAGNIGKDYCSSATTANGDCSKSESVFLKWLYNVTTDFSRLKSDGSSTALIHSTYQATISLNTSNSTYGLPSDLEKVVMNGIELTNGNEYSYNSSSGLLIIHKVTGDISIEASAQLSCLIKGTRILLADGTYKNVENIKYDDLLAVYNHETGGITYEYPIWIEKPVEVNIYQKTTFSDGTILKTYADHGVFSIDALKYVSVNDKNNFKVGTKVAKINKDGTVKIVTVKDIEIIKEKTNYYNISSTRFHNVIAENLLTTDGSITSSNVFSFNKDIIWTNERKEYLETKDLFFYDKFKVVFPQFDFPEHIFMGYRMPEMKHLYNQGLLDIKLYYDNLKNLGLDPIKDSQNNNLWMVTTSDDIVINKKQYLRKEGSTYTLPNAKLNKNFIGWYNTADGKIYQAGEKIRVVYGMHFIAQYENS